MKPLVILIALFGGCAQTARPLAEGGAPGRGDIVLSGEIVPGGVLELRAASGRVYSVRAPDCRFTVAVPAGVYDVTSIAGVTPVVPLSFNAIPGDRLDLGRFDATARTVSVCPAPDHSRRADYFGASATEPPLHYYARTGSVARPLPVPANWGGGSRAGMGRGLRSR